MNSNSYLCSSATTATMSHNYLVNGGMDKEEPSEQERQNWKESLKFKVLTFELLVEVPDLQDWETLIKNR